MKKLIILAFISLLFGEIQAQNNRQPQNGIPIMTEEMNQKRFSKISQIKRMTSRSRVSGAEGASVTHVDNSILPFFPPIFNQVANSCAFASCIGYIYTYELNCLLNRECKSNSHLLNYLHAYNYLNNGEDPGGYPDEVWDFVASNGCPSKQASRVNGIKEWTHGYDKYLNGMSNRVLEYFQIDPAPDYAANYNNLEKMKQYLIDHGDGSTYGGLIQFSGYAHPLDASRYTGPSETGYDAIIPYFGTDGMHSMTIVGFDDSIEYDYNDNGIISDDEKGAFLCVNTWGTSWGDNGRFYAPYKTFLELRQGRGGTGNGGKQCLLVRPKVLDTKVAFKVRMVHSSRNDIRLRIGVSPNPNATSPAKTEDLLVMNANGGDNQLRGFNSDSYEVFEFGVDATSLMDHVKNYDEMAFFLEIIDNTKGKAGSGQILYCSLMDYRNDSNNPNEILASVNSTDIKNGATCTAIAKIKKNVIEDDVNSDVVDFWSGYEKKLTLILNCKKAAQLNVDILNSKGNLVCNKVSKLAKSGTHSEEVDISDLSAGTYAYRVILDNQIIYKRIVIK